MILEVVHRTQYRYSQPVSLGPHILRLRPRSDGSQVLHRYDLQVSPGYAGRSDSSDLNGNAISQLWFEGSAEKLVLESRALVETRRENPFDFIPIQHAATEARTSRMSLLTAPPHPASAPADQPLYDFCTELLQNCKGELLWFLNELTRQLYRRTRQVNRLTGDPLPPQVTFVEESGTCRDMAALFVHLCRLSGLSARFVSGYYFDLPEREEYMLHAWAEVYIPGGGWRGYDPSCGLACADRHIAVAAADCSHGAAPVSGSFRGDEWGAELQFTVELRHLASVYDALLA